MDDDQDLLDGLDDDTDTGSDSDSGDGDTDAPPAGKPDGDGGKGDKRVNDLMSKWQAEQAKVKRLEAQLAQRNGKPAGTEPAIPAHVQAWMDAAKDGATERFYNSDPRFAEYGLDRALFEAAATPDELKATTKRWRDLLDTVESKARAKALDEFGLVPESVGSSAAPKKDYASMSDEEIEKEIRRHGGGGSYLG